MANLDGTRSNGGRHELEVSARMTSDSVLLQDVYIRIVRAARAEGIDRDRLPDFLQLEDGDKLWLAGQEELLTSEVERELEGMVEKWARERQDIPSDITQRLLTSTVRIGQHRFAKAVLKNHGDRCVFCGMGNIIAGRRRPRMLTASHIKPWRDSTNKERLDHLNGLTACPTHDVAFDTGLISVAGDLSITYTPDLEDVLQEDEPLRRAFGKPPLADRLMLPQNADLPDAAYLEWHRDSVFAAVSR
ncbi:HNH endonuclease [Rhodococcus artemisiae]|uniref:HNH endonuclease n=1 Tax=Rhodococcus artemisiae TaxID=714159 RepID=A0ABU7LJ31_9NOCA|nr:HNH endonuclease [Rhodococcus artemisiae]MEE2061511.1 HNH endonuclease [Rhodococcus artemisiae]